MLRIMRGLGIYLRIYLPTGWHIPTRVNYRGQSISIPSSLAIHRREQWGIAALQPWLRYSYTERIVVYLTQVHPLSYNKAFENPISCRRFPREPGHDPGPLPRSIEEVKRSRVITRVPSVSRSTLFEIFVDESVDVIHVSAISYTGWLNRRSRTLEGSMRETKNVSRSILSTQN